MLVQQVHIQLNFHSIVPDELGDVGKHRGVPVTNSTSQYFNSKYLNIRNLYHSQHLTTQIFSVSATKAGERKFNELLKRPVDQDLAVVAL